MEPNPSTYEDIVGLRVCRNYLPRPIPGSDVEAIVEAARWTGSSKNTQKWSFVILDRRERLDALAVAGRFTTPVRNAVLAVAIVWPPDGYEFDIGRAAQNMMLAAAALGISSCPVTLHDEELAREVLGAPAGHRCRYAVAFGYPDEEAEAGERSKRKASGMGGRKPIEEVAFQDRFPG